MEAKLELKTETVKGGKKKKKKENGILLSKR